MHDHSYRRTPNSIECVNRVPCNHEIQSVSARVNSFLHIRKFINTDDIKIYLISNIWESG